MIQYKVVITKGETFMDKDAVQNQPIIRYEDEQLIETEDSYVTEFPLTIMVNGKEFATVICSPTHLVVEKVENFIFKMMQQLLKRLCLISFSLQDKF